MKELAMAAGKQEEHAEEKTREEEKEKEKEPGRAKVRFEVYGEEMVEKEVKLSGNSGRVYLPPDWVGKQVKIVRIN
jgi:putative transposon-encoded protein